MSKVPPRTAPTLAASCGGPPTRVRRTALKKALGKRVVSAGYDGGGGGEGEKRGGEEGVLTKSRRRTGDFGCARPSLYTSDSRPHLVTSLLIASQRARATFGYVWLGRRPRRQTYGDGGSEAPSVDHRSVDRGRDSSGKMEATVSRDKKAH